MASASVKPAMAAPIRGSRVAFGRTEGSGIDQLPKEMQDMKLKDTKRDSHDDDDDDKVILMVSTHSILQQLYYMVTFL